MQTIDHSTFCRFCEAGAVSMHLDEMEVLVGLALEKHIAVGLVIESRTGINFFSPAL